MNNQVAAAAAGIQNSLSSAVTILGLQPAALVDHVARVDWSLLDRVPGDRGGSIPVAYDELEHILNEVKIHVLSTPEDPSPVKTNAGGSVANTIRVFSGVVGACGDDEQGRLFVSNMSSRGVNLSRLRMKKGPTVCLIGRYALGNRTMRPCLSCAVKIQWLVLRFAAFNLEVIRAAIRFAKQEKVLVPLDLASFEMVRNFKAPLMELLKSGDIDLCFANEDEAMELLSPEAALNFLAKHCQWAVVTLGSKGSMAKHGNEVVRVPAIGESKAVDATGAGDLFASGFLYGLVNGLFLKDCCRVGSCSGSCVIRSLGGEVTPENWQWMYKQMQINGLPLPNLKG
ncbi:putative sugar kinase [Drosera capensis]